MSIKKWIVSELDKNRASEIADKWDIPFFLSMMLDIRDIVDEKEIGSFLAQQDVLSNPFNMIDMDKAVQRIEKAINDFEKICVYGDYDADGITSTALLYSYLESRGASVVYYIPERDLEGYGLNIPAINKLNQDGINLIVTVDNGVVSVDEVAHAKELGIDVVITDHHRPREVLPDAVAVVDPHRKDCPSEFKDFAGVGVAFKLICALEGEEIETSQLLENYSDLVAIGTIADVVPLISENRALVKSGMKYISNMDRPGIRALLEECGLDDKKVTAGNISYTLIPRINAGGRLSSSNRAVKLLLCDDIETACDIAAELSEENSRRRNIESKILNQVEEFLIKDPKRRFDRVIVIDGEDWHQGVIGIVSSRITDKYGKPSIIISKSGCDAKGSGRSVAGFSLCDAICACSKYLTRFGGHPMAAGLNMESKYVDDFRAAINDYAMSVSEDMPEMSLKIDCKLNPVALSTNIIDQLYELEPFGFGNPTPVFGLFNMTLKEIIPVAGGRHLRLVLEKKDTSITVMQFGVSKYEFSYIEGDILDLAVTLDKSEYRGQENLSIFARDIKLSNIDIDSLIKQKKLYERIKRKEPIIASELKMAIPLREEFAYVYRFLRSNKGWNNSVYVLHYRINNDKIYLAKLLIILEVMSELNLIYLKINGDVYEIDINDNSNKVDLLSSKILQGIQDIKVVEDNAVPG